MKREFNEKYDSFKNKRAYFFIVLLYIRHTLQPEQTEALERRFLVDVKNKILKYEEEIGETENANFVNFRVSEIVEMKESIHSFSLFLKGRVEEAVRAIFQKDKKRIVKLHEYEATLKTTEKVELFLLEKKEKREVEERPTRDSLADDEEE